MIESANKITKNLNIKLVIDPIARNCAIKVPYTDDKGVDWVNQIVMPTDSSTKQLKEDKAFMDVLLEKINVEIKKTMKFFKHFGYGDSEFFTMRKEQLEKALKVAVPSKVLDSWRDKKKELPTGKEMVKKLTEYMSTR